MTTRHRIFTLVAGTGRRSPAGFACRGSYRLACWGSQRVAAQHQDELLAIGPGGASAPLVPIAAAEDDVHDVVEARVVRPSRLSPVR